LRRDSGSYLTVLLLVADGSTRFKVNLPGLEVPVGPRSPSADPLVTQPASAYLIRIGITASRSESHPSFRVGHQSYRNTSSGHPAFTEFPNTNDTQGPPTGCDSPSSVASGRNRENSAPPRVPHLDRILGPNESAFKTSLVNDSVKQNTICRGAKIQAALRIC
jgi:hypothetical protein